MPTSDTVLMEAVSSPCLEQEFTALRQLSLDRLAKMLADEWVDQREKD